MSASVIHKPVSSVLMGAAFLMATSAIGPGFITQTTVFTQQLLTSFGFVILCSILLDIGAQLNIWRIISVSGLRAQVLANKLLPGLGYLLAVLVVAGGLAFNIGNVAGAGLGINVLSGLDTLSGAVISAVIALFIFWIKEAGNAMDLFSKVLGFVMIGLTLYVAISSHPPVMEAIHHSFLPEKIDTTAIVTLVGGTVGGYISFTGAHRLLDAGVTGPQNLTQVTRGSVTAILIASVMRILLFMAALGVVMAGGVLDAKNPAASVFEIAAGNAGLKIFGVVLWSASITSIVGSAYTSVSFLRSFHPLIDKNHRLITTVMIVISTIIFGMVERPVNVLIIVGALNGFILPVALGIILLAALKKKLVGNYRHPWWLSGMGWIVVILMSFMGIKAIFTDLGNFWK
ncbi:MAG TPA: NRAMP family divalent metal transporter [Ferruginibacter sp.]|nr:NRAMP family divalent metal transporter [Ferruginibacter sp.]